MKKSIVAIAFLIFAFLAAIPASACEPCQEMMPLEDAAAEADLIIVGAMVSEGPSTGDGPDWINVQILELWKGTLPSERIRVNSWDGMCLYGIPAEQGQFLMLLKQSGDQYVTVNYGCAISRYTLDPAREQVIVDDQPVSYSDFIARLGPDIQRRKISDPQPFIEPPPTWLVILIVIATVIALAALAILVISVLRHRGNSSDTP